MIYKIQYKTIKEICKYKKNKNQNYFISEDELINENKKIISDILNNIFLNNIFLIKNTAGDVNVMSSDRRFNKFLNCLCNSFEYKNNLTIRKILSYACRCYIIEIREINSTINYYEFISRFNLLE